MLTFDRCATPLFHVLELRNVPRMDRQHVHVVDGNALSARNVVFQPTVLAILFLSVHLRTFISDAFMQC